MESKMQDVDWDRLTAQLEELGFSKPGMREYLEGCGDMEHISYYQRARYGNDLVRWEVGIKKDDSTGLYYPEGYNTILLQTHPIQHRLCGNIDTRDLEQRMKDTDWREYDRKAVQPGDKTSKIFDDVFELVGSREAAAKDIARRLELRYWLDTPVEQHLDLGKYIYRYEKRASFELNNGLEDIHAREAYNLLCGRSVLKFYQKEGEPASFYTYWKQFEKSRLQMYPAYDLTNVLRSLPLKELHNDREGPQLIYGLIRGDRMPAHIDKEGHTEPVFIEADARKQSVKLYSAALTALNLGAFTMNEVQRQQYNKKMVPKHSSNNIKKPKGRSL